MKAILPVRRPKVSLHFSKYKTFLILIGLFFFQRMDLQSEINRLQRELDQAQTDKEKSATYGLGLLADREALTKRCEELENLYENARQECEFTQEVTYFAI